MLKVEKSLNNNIVLAVNELGEEIVAFGTGIGFKKKKGDDVDQDTIKKFFTSAVDQSATSLLEEVSPEILATTEKIIQLAEERLHQVLNPVILFSLSDHIKFAMDRQEKQLSEGNPIQWEIPHLYYEEYMIGKESLRIVEEDLGVALDNSEASFIALHFVNAQSEDATMGETVKITQITKEIVKIIQAMFDTTLDKTSLTYSRFITHVRYFITRQRLQQPVALEIDDTLKSIVQERYETSYECSLMIKAMLEKKYGWQVTEDELIYLVIHIERIINENKR